MVERPCCLELEPDISELELFAAALLISDASGRSEYLDRVCGKDTALRQRLAVLLRNHEEAGSFMETPAAPQRPEAASGEQELTERLEGLVPAGVAEVQHAARTASQAEQDDEEDALVLDFLQPPTQPGSLGRLGHYEVLEVLGQGGFGIVVRAFDEKLHRMVAIKIMAPRLAVTSPARKRFIREARSSAAVRHENVVDIHAIEEQPIPFLVMEYVAGETLQQRLDRTGPLDPVTVLRIGVQLSRGLAAAHVMGQIHRDIKPANIMLERGIDRVKITDFGLARATDDASLSQSGVIAGTPLYMAPEQAQCAALDQRADLFSLGSVLYVMCSGRPPFRAPTTLGVLKRVAEDTPRPIREIIPEVPEWLCDVIARLHAKKPGERFQTATEVAEILERYLTELQLHGKVSQEPQKTKPTWNFPRWFAVAAVFVLALTGLGLTEAAGVTHFSGSVIRLFSLEGTLVVELDDPDVSVNIDGEEVVIKGAGAKEIRMKPGQHQVQASKDGKIVQQELVTVTRNGRQVVRISREVAEAIDVDRRAAEYALAIGGTIHVIDQGIERGLYPGGGVSRQAFDLTVVSLFRNQNVDDAGLDHFKGCRYLRNLDLEQTKVSAAKILEMKRALPNCKIDWDGDNRLLPGSPDRRAAEYVLSIGGSVNVKGGGLYRPAYSRSALPQGAFDLRWATLQQNQRVSDADLVLFKDCNLLQGISLGGTKVSDAGLVHLGELKHLTSLDLSDTRVSDAGLAHLKDLLSLVGLGLNGTGITDAGLAHFKYCQNLAGLDLGGTKVSNEGLVYFKDRKNLARLALGRTNVSDAGLIHFKDCQKLAQLDLTGSPVGDAGLAYFKDSRNLTHLYLGGTRLSDVGLAHFKDCERLAFLELYQTGVSDAGLTHLKDCKNLSHLDLAGSRISDAGLTQIAGYPKLYTLNVKGTKISEVGVKKLAANLPTCRIEWDGGVIEPTINSDPDRRVAEWLQSPPGASLYVLADGEESLVSWPHGLPRTPFQLTRLYVNRHPNVSDECLTIFKGVRHLTHLIIINCELSDAGLICFKDCKQLQELQLVGTRVTNVGLAYLADCAELQYLNLRQTAVTEEAVRKLVAALPKCKIDWDGGVIEAR